MVRPKRSTTYDYPMNMKPLFEKCFQKYHDRTAVRFEGESLTYRELNRQANAAANALVNHGIELEDRVALLMSNRPEFLVARIAIIKAGAAVLPLNDMLSTDEIEYMLSLSEAKAIFCGPDFISTIDDLREGLGDLEARIAIDGGDTVPAGFANFHELVAEGDGTEPPERHPTPDSIAAHQYTGGTTGKPKGVVFTEKSRTFNLVAHDVEMDIDESDTILITTPLPHAGRMISKTALLNGAEIILADQYDPARFLSAIEEHEVDWTFMVPTMIYNLLDSGELENYDYSTIDTIMYGASPITPNRLREAVDHFGPVFKQFYGQNEVTALISTLGKEEHVIALSDEDGSPFGEELLKSAGYPCLFADVKIVDPETGEEVGPNEEGEIVATAPYTMKEYYKRPDETEETLEDGWVHTGDIGMRDETGYLYLLDRKSDMIVSGGMNVYSTEVEDVLAKHPGVNEVAVIGIPDDYWGEAVHAVIKRSSAEASEESIAEFADEHLAKYKKPKSIEFVDAIPETPYGKMDKKALRSQYWADEERAIR